MKVKIIGLEGYNYMKDGKQKVGQLFTVCNIDHLEEDDHNGNYKFGVMADKVFVPIALNLSQYELLEYLGRNVDLVFERALGSRFERLVDIKIL